MTDDQTQRLSELLDAVFEHRIGDHVTMADDLAVYRAERAINGPLDSARAPWASRLGIRRPAVVIERQVQQCHGGTQLHYLISHKDLSKDGTETTYRKWWVTGLEIRPYVEAIVAVQAMKPAETLP